MGVGTRPTILLVGSPASSSLQRLVISVRSVRLCHFLCLCAPSVSRKAHLKFWPFESSLSSGLLSPSYPSTLGEPPHASTTRLPGSPIAPLPDAPYPRTSHQALLLAQSSMPQPVQMAPPRKHLALPPLPILPPLERTFSEDSHVLDRPRLGDTRYLPSTPHPSPVISTPSSLRHTAPPIDLHQTPSPPPLITDVSYRMTTVTGNTVCDLLRRNAFWAHCPVCPSSYTMDIGTDFLLDGHGERLNLGS